MPNDRLSLCIVTPYEPSLTETFIRGHITGLAADVKVIDSWSARVDGRLVLAGPRRAWHRGLRLLGGHGIEQETTASYMQAFRRYRPHAVLAEYGTTGVMVMDACSHSSIPLIVHFHGFDASVRSFLEEHAESYQVMFQQAGAVIAVSLAMREKLISLGCPPEKLYYNPCGVDCDEFVMGQPASVEPIFLAVGSFREKKAPDLTLRAFAEVHARCPEAKLRMVGEGAMLDSCRQLAAELGVADAVTFPGGLSHQSVIQEMKGARCFVQHSVEATDGDCEGTPVAILEAGAAGLPVVSTRHAGIPDVVIDSETGFLVAERDTQGMAERMLRFAHQPGLAEAFGRAGRKRVSSYFSMDKSLQRLRSIIEYCVPHRQSMHVPNVFEIDASSAS